MNWINGLQIFLGGAIFGVFLIRMEKRRKLIREMESIAERCSEKFKEIDEKVKSGEIKFK